MTTVAPFPAEPLLLVDDEPSWLHSLAFTLEYSGGFTNLQTCNDSRELIGRLRCQKYSLVLLDLVMPHVAGEDLLVQIGQESPGLPVIVLSGLNQLETAVRCMKLGAFDYYVKTTEPDRLLAGIHHALKMSGLQRENRELANRLLRRELRHPEAFAAMTTRSPRLEAVFRYLEAIAGSPAPLLIIGEPGTGRRLAAEALRQLACPTAPWRSLDVAGLNEREFSARLFGGTGVPGLLAEARGGMLLLRGLHELPIASQGVLAQLLQLGEYLPREGAAPVRLETRLVCTASSELPEMVGESRFRKDLFYRLSIHQVSLPPLRERREDLPLLLEQFVAEACAANARRKFTLPRNLAPLLATHSFPGNLAELRNLVFSAIERNPSSRLSLEPFRQHLARHATAPTQGGEAAVDPLLLVPGRLPSLAEARDLIIQEALHRANGNQSIAARLLGISQPALSIHLKKASPA
ncbi:MAG: sigma-54-dependent Fis family transcriptional regulator [Desulfuromonas sp.]|nr:sigma-54-dependent Fis family transcriptional regulator [Desulfuromonas sp.]